MTPFNSDLLAYLETFLSDQRKNRFLEVLKERTNYLTVVVEDVFQMHNTSAVIRSCDVFGIQTAHLVEGRFGKRLDKNIAMGAQQWVDIHRYNSISACMNALKKQGYQLIATTPNNDSCLLDDFKLDQKTALFFGTEKEGLSAEVLANVDGSLKIPMVGFSESLNISVSAAILLQKLSAQLRSLDVNWQLSPREQLEKRLDWSKKSIKSIEDILERYEKEENKI